MFLNWKSTFCSVVFLLVFVNISYSAPPVIWYTDIINGPNSGGENNNGCYLTITGTGFGTPNNQLPPTETRVYINGVEVADYKYLGQTRGRPDSWQLSVQIGPVSSGAVTVTTPEGTATAPENFTVNTGDIFYVATTGDDETGDGSYTNPYRSVRMGLNRVSTRTDNTDGGDHIVVRGGDYKMVTDAAENGVNHDAWLYLSHGTDYGLQSSTTSGRADNHVTVMGYPGEEPVGNYETSDSLRGIRTYYNEQRPYWAFSNLTIDLGISGSYATMWGYCGNCAGSTADTSNSPYARFVNITVKNGMGGCDANGGKNMASFQSSDHIKIYGMNIGSQHSTTLSSCASHVMYVSHRYANADIAYCYIHDNTYGGRAALQIAGDGAEAYYKDNVNVHVRHNLFKKLPEAGLLLGRGSYQVYIYENIFDNMEMVPHSGFAAIALRGGGGAAYGDYEFFNNTVYTDVDDSGIIQIGFQPELNEYPNSVSIRNNAIIAKSTSTAYYTINNSDFDPFERITADHNLYYGSETYNYRVGYAYSSYGIVPSWEPDVINESPSFADATGSIFTLQSDSPCIDAGTSAVSTRVTTDHTGASWAGDYDIGAYKYTGVPEPEVPAPPKNLRVQ